MEQIKKISETTLIPLSFVLVLFGFISWLTNLHGETMSNHNDVIEIKDTQKVYNQKLDRIMEKLNTMEGVLRGL
jgi:hypothetical protein